MIFHDCGFIKGDFKLGLYVYCPAKLFLSFKIYGAERCLT
nr:MAG TPA: hypothetical protein [Caudoviricetes sp.]